MATGVYKRKPFTEEHKNNIGLAHLGMRRSKQTRANISKGLTGRKLSTESKEKMRLAKIGTKASELTKQRMSASMAGIKKPPFTDEHRKNLSIAKIGKPHILSKEGKESFREKMSGVNNWRWVQDRSKLVKSEKKHLDGRYRGWMKSVKSRDGWLCRIADDKCNGRMEAHHILRWSKFPELRYEVNNGITLCAFHHPRKINDEKRLAPLFRELVGIEQ